MNTDEHGNTENTETGGGVYRLPSTVYRLFAVCRPPSALYGLEPVVRFEQLERPIDVLGRREEMR